MPQSARFWNRIARFYSKRPVDNLAAYQRKLAVTREYLQPDMQVLEFACGTGSTAIKHAPYVKQITAIDISPKMLEIAQGKIDEMQIKNIRFECATVEDFEAPDETFDVVMGHSILHLLDDKAVAINKAYRWLKPGGVFITSTPCLQEIAPYIKYIAPVGRLLGLMPSVNLFSLRQLVESITGAGFKIDHQWQPSEKEAVFIVAVKT